MKKRIVSYINTSAITQYIISLIPLLATSFVLRFEFESSMGYFPFSNTSLAQWPKFAVINIVTIFFFEMILFTLYNNLFMVSTVCTVLGTLISVINYYTIKYHGFVVTIQDINLFLTATDVVGEYSFHIESNVVFIIVLSLFNLVFLAFYKHKKNNYRNNLPLRFRVPITICLLSILFILYSGALNIIPPVNGTWRWSDTYKEYGFVAGTIESTISYSKNIVIKPERYDNYYSSIKSLAYNNTPTTHVTEYPDFIFILNESYYDLRDVGIRSDINAFENYDNLDAIKGKAIIPGVGGGTNASEYELLTSNSISILNTSNPFVSSLSKECNSLFSYFKSLGYSTLAAHPASPENYRRKTVWSSMDVDYYYFREDFSTDSKPVRNGQYLSDSSMYSDFFSFYDLMPADSPRFCFLITMQNHGGYDASLPEEDLVHVIGKDSEPMYDQLNEFLTCVKYSDDAILELINSLTAINDRKVILCMVGDHAPSFINEVALEESSPTDDNSLNKRIVPFLLWGNYPLSHDGLDGTQIDICRLAPEVLKTADIPLSYYYDYILSIDGDIYYDEVLSHELDLYFCLEYYGLTTPPSETKHLFEASCIYVDE